MNNKILISIIVIVLVGIIGTGSHFIVSKNNTNNVIQNHKNYNNQDNKIAIIYFSATGTTKKVAEYIQEETKGDLIEIIPQEKYTNDDLNYNNNNSRANKEQNDSNARPEIANPIDINSYDIIYLGFPIWWGDVPKIILTFLDTYNLNGKTIIPFCTSHSSGISQSLNTLKNYNENVNWKDGKKFHSSAKEEINNWINEGD